MASIYLNRKHFYGMILVAAGFHMMGAVAYMTNAGTQVTKIPVHVLNIKLGSGELLAMSESSSPDNALRVSAPTAAALPVATPPPHRMEREKEKPTPKPVVTKKKAPEVKKIKEVPKLPPPAALKGVENENYAPVSSTAQASTGAASTKPSQYVRSMGSAKGEGEGSPLGNSVSGEAEVMRRYEQLISIWIQRHKMYPETLKRQGIQGTGMVRIQIDRLGNIKRFKLERSTGSQTLDDSIIAMVRAADPVPPVPKDYPAGNLIEFLIPVRYKIRSN